MNDTTAGAGAASSLQGIPVSTTAPTDMQVLAYSVASGNKYVPITVPNQLVSFADLATVDAPLIFGGDGHLKLKTAAVNNGAVLRFNATSGAWEPHPVQSVTTVPTMKDAGASTTTTTRVLTRLESVATITSITLTPSTNGLIASDTDYATITISRTDSTTGSPIATLATLTTKTSGSGGTGTWTAGLTINAGTLANTSASAGDLITYSVSKTGNGVALPEILWTIKND